MNNKAIKTILSVAALSLTAGIASTAAAGSVDETLVHGQALPEQRVSFHRSDLATEDGRAIVERRIKRAAENVCGSQNLREVGSLSIVARNRECYDGAVAQAMDQINGQGFAAID